MVIALGISIFAVAVFSRQAPPPVVHLQHNTANRACLHYGEYRGVARDLHENGTAMHDNHAL